MRLSGELKERSSITRDPRLVQHVTVPSIVLGLVNEVLLLLYCSKFGNKIFGLGNSYVFLVFELRNGRIERLISELVNFRRSM